MSEWLRKRVLRWLFPQSGRRDLPMRRRERAFMEEIVHD